MKKMKRKEKKKKEKEKWKRKKKKKGQFSEMRFLPRTHFGNAVLVSTQSSECEGSVLPWAASLISPISMGALGLAWASSGTN